MAVEHFTTGVVIWFGLYLAAALAQVRPVVDHVSPQLDWKLLQLLYKIRQEQHFDTVLVYNRGRDSCVFNSMLPRLPETPAVLVNNGSTGYEWTYSSTTLVLCCDASAEAERNSRTLLKLQQARRLIYTDNTGNPLKICNAYFAREVHNVAVVNAYLGTKGFYYTCRRFGSNETSTPFVEQHLLDGWPVFVQQFRDMRGAPIVTDSDQLAPRSMLYRDERSGEIKMLGYVAMLLNTFADKLNATLKLRNESEFGRIIFYGDLEDWTQKNLIDIATSVTVSLLSNNLDYLSYPYLLTNYCLMLPVPSLLPYKQIYTIIVDPLVLCIILLLFCIFSLLLIYSQHLSWRQLSIVNVLLNDKSLRGLLGQSFPPIDNPSKNMKLICFLLCFASLMMTTMYGAYLQSFFAKPPSEPFLRSSDDVSKSRFLILISTREADVILSSSNRTSKSTRKDRVQLTDDFNEFVRIRDSFNTNYIFPVTGLRWRTYQEQQKLFQEPMFYYSEELCLNRFFVLCVPIRRELPFRDLFEEHMLHVQEFGLVEQWIEWSFYDMVHLGLTSLEDLSRRDVGGEAINLEDLSWILYLYSTFIFMSCMCFIAEHLMFRCQRQARRRAARNVQIGIGAVHTSNRL